MKFNSILKQIWFAVILLLSIMIISESYAAITVKSVNPKANAINISADSSITVEFDTSINSATVSVNTFTVNGSVSGFHKGTFDVSGSKIIFDPEKDFAVGETVTVILTTGIKSTGGSSLAAPLASQFVVASGGIAYFIDSNQILGDVSNSSVALGDIDNDGDPDAFVTNAKTDRIWKNKGSGIFEGQNIGSVSSHAAFGDFNKDGYIDLFAANLNGSNKIWLNDKTGNFTGGQSIGDFGHSCVAVGDLDGDGDIDAFVIGMVNNTVWLNKGTGEFEEGQILEGSGGSSVALGDLNGDGYLDAFIANQGADNVWMNNGKGFFTKKANNELDDDLRNSTGVALGDLDGDGDLDAFVVNTYNLSLPDEKIYWINWAWENDGTGVFKKYPKYIELLEDASKSMGVSLGDLDGDGDIDAFVINDGSPNNIWLNKGTGEFYKGQTFTENANSWGIALGDLDGDGALDAFIANNSQSNKVLLNKIYPGDIDGNGIVDLKDAITGLKILIAIADSKGIFLNDVNGDKKIGTEDVSFILQIVSLIR